MLIYYSRFLGIGSQMTGGKTLRRDASGPPSSPSAGPRCRCISAFERETGRHAASWVDGWGEGGLALVEGAGACARAAGPPATAGRSVCSRTR
ncbi:hypothetical protein GWI33_020942 [Rhynchophorus ferrugineus]|uniref:Uncharacterized protein n=1 Tax=Rhynchophorus ferrugineus TaxID=354439 RepID=A0A834HNK7_RHYFE|nr:hypothetical protein GWI33_020942 [Rhynchophorus ferrugineus]